MTEFLAVLTVIFVVYVLYEVFKTVSQADQGQSPSVASTTVAASSASVEATAAETAEVTAAAPGVEPDRTVSLRNPATGETTPAPSNYRFAKKWIKEALVVEGLLEKIYKNSELTETVNGRVKEALMKFRQLEKYHA